MKKITYHDKVRDYVIKQTHGRCGYCGKTLQNNSEWHLDHANPRPRPKYNGMANELIIPACVRCNIQKGHRNIEQYREYLKGKRNVDSITFYLDLCTLFPVPDIFPSRNNG